MALFLFTKSILNDEPIKVFNNGKMIRDFTFIDDISESLFRIIKKPATPDKYFDTNNPNPLKVGLRIEFLILAIQNQYL